MDDKRLGKQRVECLQILNALARTEWSCSECGEPQTEFMSQHPTHIHNIILTPWYRHPAVKMWKGFETALISYGLSMCIEWTYRGFKDTCASKIIKMKFANARLIKPPWLGNPNLHFSHQSNLVRKLPERYSKLWPKIPNDMPYFWPVK